MQVVAFNQKKIFTRETAQGILPVIFKFTESSHREVQILVRRMESIRSMSPLRADEIEEQINQIVEKWQAKIIKLGAKPKGLWLADFDNGKGYFCWKYPEVKISFCHGYNDGFSGRVALDIELTH